MGDWVVDGLSQGQPAASDLLVGFPLGYTCIVGVVCLPSVKAVCVRRRLEVCAEGGGGYHLGTEVHALSQFDRLGTRLLKKHTIILLP